MPAGAESRVSRLPRSILRRKSYLGTPCWGTMLTKARKGLYCSPCVHPQKLLATAGPCQSNEGQCTETKAKQDHEQQEMLMLCVDSFNIDMGELKNATDFSARQQESLIDHCELNNSTATGQQYSNRYIGCCRQRCIISQIYTAVQ